MRAQSRDRPQRRRATEAWLPLWLILLGALGALGVSAACRRAPSPPLPPLVPQVTGASAVAGLKAPVRVVRDTWGVPHIYAEDRDDLFFAQGFVQAQDRLFQMDLWRRSVQGRLSEVLGPNFIERDAMTRRMQYRGDPGAEWASLGPDARAIAEAFVRGVNAWVVLARERPPEAFVLAGWKPEPWAAADLLNRTDAFTASGDALDEVFRSRLTAAVGLARARLLLPGNRALEIPQGLDVAAVPDLVSEAIRRVGTPPFFLVLAAPVTEGTVRLKPDTTSSVGVGVGVGGVGVGGVGVGGVGVGGVGVGGVGVGSVGGPGTPGSVRLQPDSDAPRALANPSPHYFVHLHAPGWNVIGATAPWLPGVAAGHNDRIAWTAEPFDADTQDLYVERLNPANPRQVDDGGRWVDIETRREFVAVRGRKTPVDFERDATRHGVIVASDRERHLAFALRWSGSEPGAAAGLAATALDRAASWPEFRSALGRWKMPARRMIYGDADGRRGMQAAALVPVRRGSNGAMPAAGWSGATEWSGWRTLDDLPHAIGAARAGAAAFGAATDVAHPSPALAAQMIVDAMRLHPDRADALLQKLAAASSSPESLTAQRAALVDVLADALRERLLPAGGAVVFAHPLGISDAARRRFNVTARARAGAMADPLAFVFDTADWDRSTAIDAPGQSGSPDSAHYADLVPLWSDGRMFPLVFSDAAVQAHANATLTLTPK